METASHTETTEPSGVRGLAEASFSYLEARGRLLQLEAQEAGQTVGRMLVVGLIAVCSFILAWLLVIPVIVWALAKWGGWPWQPVAGALALAHLLVAIVCVISLRLRAARLRLFEETIQQCRRDRECISQR